MSKWLQVCACFAIFVGLMVLAAWANPNKPAKSPKVVYLAVTETRDSWERYYHDEIPPGLTVGYDIHWVTQKQRWGLDGQHVYDRFKVGSTPTYIKFVDGKEVKRHCGSLNQKEFVRWANDVPAPEDAEGEEK